MALHQLFCYAVCYVIEGLSAWFYFEHLFTRKKSGTYIAIFMTGIYAVLYLLFLVGEFLLNSALFCLGNILILCLCYRCGKTAMVVHSAFMTVTMILTEIAGLVFVRCVLPIDSLEAIHGAPSALLAYSCASKILYFLVLLLFARIYRPRGDKKEESYAVLLLCVLPVASIIVSVVIIYSAYTVESIPWVNFLMMAGTVALLTANFLVLAINNQLQKLAEERTELQMSMQKEQADAEYYRMLQQQYDNQRVLIHDLKNYLCVLQTLAEEGRIEELQQYIAAMENLPEFRKKLRWCDNAILNAILLRYAQLCEQQGVAFHCDIRKDCIFFDPAAVTALFGNLLSNALEAAAQAERKSVELSVRKSHGNSVVVTVVNSCREAPPMDADGELISRKRNKSSHGLGLKSIRRVLQQYNGISKMYYDEEEKQFHSVLRFSMEQ